MDYGISFYSRKNVYFSCPSPKADSLKGLRLACEGRTGGFPGDEFGYYPWDPVWQGSDSNGIPLVSAYRVPCL